MLRILGDGSRFCDGLTRRSFLQIGGLAMGGMSLPQMLQAEARSQVGSSSKGIIMVLLPGGPPHLDMYDLKPEAPVEVRGEFSPISTNVPGIEICELMPRFAANMDKLVPIRSLVGAHGDHTIHQCITGWESHPAPPVIASTQVDVPGYPPGGWPSMGAVLSKVHGPVHPGVPPSVDLTPVYFDARFAVGGAAPGQAGYLGAAHAGFEIEAIDRRNIVLNGIGLNRLSDRRTLLTSLDRFRRESDSTGAMDGMDSFTQQAFEVLTDPRLAKALDLSREDSRTRRRYSLSKNPAPKHGDYTMLDQFLIARRVIEAGARCVTLVFSRWPFGRFSQGDFNWDWHRGNFTEARNTLPGLDHGVATLVEDLDERGMLDDISVVVWGEFGRTPKINKNAGRDHWPQVGGGLLAGGGLRTGQVLGSTNRLGEYVTDRPVHFREVFATLYHQFGIDLERTQFHDLAGRPHYLVDDRKPLPELV
jgi:hypothetical protein